MADALDRGFFGEQGAGFFLGAQGYYFIDGPSGAKGHAANASGFDGIAYNAQLNDLIIFDNKAFAAARNVASGTAIDPLANLAVNLDALIVKVQGMRDLPNQGRILGQLSATRAAIANGKVAPPKGVRIAITNYGGNSKGNSGPLASRGIEFIDMKRTAPVAPKPKPSRAAILGVARRAPIVDQAHLDRAAHSEALAMGAAWAAQGYNDFAVDTAINRETENLVDLIARHQEQGLGTLIIYVITAQRMEMVTTRCLEAVEAVAGATCDAAFERWRGRPTMGRLHPPSVIVENRFRWIAPITL